MAQPTCIQMVASSLHFSRLLSFGNPEDFLYSLPRFSCHIAVFVQYFGEVPIRSSSNLAGETQELSQ